VLLCFSFSLLRLGARPRVLRNRTCFRVRGGSTHIFPVNFTATLMATKGAWLAGRVDGVGWRRSPGRDVRSAEAARHRRDVDLPSHGNHI